MKKRNLFLMSALLLMGSKGVAQVVTASDVEAVPGETVKFSLNLSEGKADVYTALTFDVVFPATGFSTTGDYSVSDLWKGATAVIGDVDESGVATIPFASSNSIEGTTVENLVTVFIKVGDNVPTGNYDVTLSNIMFEYGMSDKDYASDVTFSINVVTAHSVLLDETATSAPQPISNANVPVLRTINAGEWSTICLPFTMTEEQVKVAFGDDVQIADFTGYDAAYDAEDYVTALTVSFNDVTTIEANHPYIIKVGEAVTEFTVDGVTIDPEDVPCVALGTTTGKGKNAVYHPMDFTGTYVADFDFYNDAQSRALFLYGNKFYYATSSTNHMKAFRAYFDFDDVLASVENASSRITMAFDNISAGISSSNRETINDNYYYDLQGRRVANPGKGVFVKDGKKIIIK